MPDSILWMWRVCIGVQRDSVRISLTPLFTYTSMSCVMGAERLNLNCFQLFGANYVCLSSFFLVCLIMIHIWNLCFWMFLLILSIVVLGSDFLLIIWHKPATIYTWARKIDLAEKLVGFYLDWKQLERSWWVLHWAWMARRPDLRSTLRFQWMKPARGKDSHQAFLRRMKTWDWFPTFLMRYHSKFLQEFLEFSIWIWGWCLGAGKVLLWVLNSSIWEKSLERQKNGSTY